MSRRKPKRVFDHLRDRIHAKAGLVDSGTYQGVTFEGLRAVRCKDGFCAMMDNRVMMGQLRYGDVRHDMPPFKDLEAAITRMERYMDTGNTEFLVDAANFCRLEFARSKHPRKHFRAEDRE